MRKSPYRILALLTCFATATAQDPSQLQKDLVTQSFPIRDTATVQRQTNPGGMLHRLLTPGVGKLAITPKGTLVVKDTSAVVEGIGVLLAHYDGLAAAQSTTRVFTVRHCGDLLAAQNSEFLASLRKLSTPAVGRMAYDPKNRALLVTDKANVLTEIEKVIKQVDVAPGTIAMDIQFVTTRNAKLWRQSIAPRAAASGGSIGTLTATEASAIMRSVKQDLYSRIVQAPKMIALDHREASVYVGPSQPNAARGTGFSARLVPHIVPSSNALILDVLRGSGAANEQVLVRPGTTVVYRDSTQLGEVFVFVTPKPQSPAKPSPGRGR